MCAIVDANKFGDFMSRAPNKTARRFQKWIRGENGGVLVYPEIEPLDKAPGDDARQAAIEDMERLIQEYRKSPNMLALLDRYASMGKARRVKLSEVANKHPETAQARSNDRHVLAMALASGARLLYTGDGKLIRDFEDSRIIENPPGEVYSSPKHRDRLRPDICKQC